MRFLKTVPFILKNNSSQRLSLALGLLFFLSLSSCATYQGKVNESRDLLARGDVEPALVKLKELSEVKDGDQLVYLLDYGTALQIAGRFDESNRVFLLADKVSEAADYHSVSRIAGATLLSEEMIQYKGDTFEKTFINAFLALNYLQLNEYDDALVEARRINEKYVKLRGEDKKSYEVNPFAKYLSALVWEATGKYDDAYIAYAETYKLDPTIPSLEEDLVRSALKAQRPDQYEKWKKQFPSVKDDPMWKNKKAGELVVIYLQGWGPRKVPSNASHRLPTLMPVTSINNSIEVSVENKKVQSELVYNVERASISTLNDDYGALIARRIGSAVAKDLAAQEIAKKNEALGAVAFILMHAADRADLRQWSTLPQTVQIARMPLTAGEYNVNLKGLTSSSSQTGEQKNQMVKIKAGRKTFIIYRTLK